MDEHPCEVLLEGSWRENRFKLSMETHACLFLLRLWYSLCRRVEDFPYKVTLVFTSQDKCSNILPPLKMEFNWCTVKVVSFEDLPWKLKQLRFPIAKCGLVIHCGLCAVARTLVKVLHDCEPGIHFNKLLGFKQICLKACSEVSRWAKFCEVDLPQMCHDLLMTEVDVSHGVRTLKYLDDFLTTPVVVANISKRQKDVTQLISTQKDFTQDKVTVDCIEAKLFSLSLKDQQAHGPSNSSSESTDGNPNSSGLPHLFLEGLDFTLTDVLTWPCIHFVLERKPSLLDQLPNLSLWYQRLAEIPAVATASVFAWDSFDGSSLMKTPFDILTSSQQSPQHTDETKLDQSSATATETTSIETKVKNANLWIDDNLKCFDLMCGIDWSQVPEEAHPRKGNLPQKRLERKCQQLENLALAVIRLCKDGYTIADFCSGGGHLGILLACLLPKCKVLLLENKEESLWNAVSRVEKLNLTNVTIYHCNLDHFTGYFDVGTCLHACGSATDLVLNKCLERSAAFAICPCCYGAIENKHTVRYPRSQKFSDVQISYNEYKLLSQAADHPVTGKYSMTVIDSDRAALAEEYGYIVQLKTLNPSSCSPKNNLLLASKTAL